MATVLRNKTDKQLEAKIHSKQAEPIHQQFMEMKNELIGGWRKARGLASHRIRIGRPTSVYRKGPDGKYRWYEIGCSRVVR